MSKHIYIENNRLALHEDVASLQSGKQDKLIAGNNITIASDGKTINASLSNLNDMAIYRLQLAAYDTLYVNTNQVYGPGTTVYNKFKELIDLQLQWWDAGVREAILQVSHLGFRNNNTYGQEWLNSADQALLLSAKAGDGTASRGDFAYYTYIYQTGRSMWIRIVVQQESVSFYLTIVPDVRAYSTMPTAGWYFENTVALYTGPTTSTYMNNNFYLCVNNSGTYSWQQITVGNDTQIQYTTLPTPDSSIEGKIVQYTGPTDANYINGYYYQVISDGGDPATYSWENISVQPSGSDIQVSTMPTASQDNEGQIVQYTGITDSNYTNGYFYICVSDGQDPATYSWENLSVQPNDIESKDVYMINGTKSWMTWDGSNAITSSESSSQEYQDWQALINLIFQNRVENKPYPIVVYQRNWYDNIELSNNYGNNAIFIIYYVNSTAAYLYGSPIKKHNGVTIFPMITITYNSTTHAISKVEPNTLFTPASSSSLSSKENISNKVTTISSSSTDTTYPSSKCVYDTILTMLYSQSGLSEYSSSSTYNEGDYVYYNGDIYQCNTTISTAEAWDSTHWTQITYEDYLNDTISPDMSNYIAKDNTTAYTPSGDYEPSTKKYVDDAVSGVDVSGKEDKTNKTTTVTSSSTDTQYASAKAVYDYVEGRLGDIDTILTEILNGSVNGEGMSF